MRSIALSLLVVCLFGSSLQVFTYTQFLDAINLARTNPSVFADQIQSSSVFFNKATGKWADVWWEPNCNQNAYTWLKSVAPMAPLLHSDIAVYAASKHTRWMAHTLKKLSHTGENGSTLRTRITEAGTFDVCWALNENIASTGQAYTSANEYVFQWIADCGLNPKGHRDNIYSTKITHYGCAEVKDPLAENYFATCDGVTKMTFKPELRGNAHYLEAGLN